MLRRRSLVPGLVLSLLFASGAWAGEMQDQRNDPATDSAFALISGGSFFQTFKPGFTPISAIELRLKTGSNFTGPFETTIRLREGTWTGTILTTATATIPSTPPGQQMLVRFDFASPVSVVPEQTYVIEWIAPTVDVLEWMGTLYDSYARGNFLDGAGNPVAGEDLNFITYRPQIVQWSAAAGGNGHYYEYVLGYTTWTAANTAAQAKSFMSITGHLATITSSAENAFVLSLKGNLGDMRAWIGLTDAATEGVFEWVTGEPFSYANWYPGEPNNSPASGGEDYVEFFGNGQWNDNADGSGGYNQGYVVEYDAVPNTAPVFEEPTLFADGSSFDWASGKILTFTVRAVDQDFGDLLDLTVSGLPSGATFTPVSGANPAQSVFSWTPSDAQGQSGQPFTITFTATDVIGAQATFSFTVTPSYDQDGDGLLDAWEEQGGGYTHDNGQHVDLYSMGARKDVPDIFVQIDYMKYGTFNHRPLDAAIQAIKDSFLDQGIVLHVMIDEELPSALSPELLGEEAGGAYRWSGTTPGVTYFDDIKAAHFPEELSWAVRYCVFAHKLQLGDTTSSGIARAGGSDFIVALGAYTNGVGSQDQQAGTFMHELGHLLGLKHGGDDDKTNHKPNYLSVMNYSFQMTGLVTSTHRKFDYSPMLLPALDENALNEAAGLGAGAAGYGTKWWSKSAQSFISQPDATSNVDWNGGGIQAGTVAADINNDQVPLIIGGSVIVAATDPLKGFEDWSHIDFKGGAIGAGVSLPPAPETPVPDEVTLEVVQSVLGPPPENLKAHAADGMVVLTWKPAGSDKDSGKSSDREESSHKGDKGEKDSDHGWQGGGEGCSRAPRITYNVFRHGDGDALFLGNTRESNFHDKTVVAGTTYTYSVTIVDPDTGEGAPAEVEVTAAGDGSGCKGKK